MRQSTILMVRVGGWEEWVHTVARFLAAEGFRVRAACFTYGVKASRVESQRNGYSLTEITVPGNNTNKLLKAMRVGGAMRRVLRSMPHDILYAIDVWTLPPLWAAAGGFRANGSHFAYHTFEWIEPGNHHLGQVLLERAACRGADVVVNAERVRARLMQKLYGLSRPPVWVRNSLPLDFEVPAPNDELRKTLLGKASDDAVLVICPSLVSPERRSFELIRAVGMLPERYRLVTIAPERGYGEACRQLAEEIGASDRIVFLPPMSFREVMAHISSADVGVVLHDGGGSIGNYLASPMRLSQMAVSGIPLVASALPVVEAIVYRHNLGLCCDDSCPAEIARAIRELCETRPGPRERGLRARTAFEKDLHFEKGAHKLVEALRGLK